MAKDNVAIKLRSLDGRHATLAKEATRIVGDAEELDELSVEEREELKRVAWKMARIRFTWDNVSDLPDLAKSMIRQAHNTLVGVRW